MLDRLMHAKDYIERKCDFHPEIVMVLGSGLSGFANGQKIIADLSYAEIPGFPVPTCPGHTGKVMFSRISGRNVALLSGRAHIVDGYTAAETVIGLRTMFLLGARTALLTNAAGGINMRFRVGDLMSIEDHIDFSGRNPLIGQNLEMFGPRYPDMTYAYSPKLRKLLDEIAAEKGIGLQRGVYAYSAGPSYETPAEIRALRVLGADAVGMSTVQEVVACAHAGIPVAAISCISNMAAGIEAAPLNHDEVLEAGDNAMKKLSELLTELIRKAPTEEG